MLGTERPEGESSAAQVHRPLPSIDIPLLRDERRASRSRRAVWGSLILVAGGGSIAVGVAVRALRGEDAQEQTVTAEGGGEQQAESAAELADPSLSAAADSSSANGQGSGGGAASPSGSILAPKRIEAPFGKARGFRKALLAMGASREECVALEKGLDKILDFRRCRPADRLVFERDGSGKLVRFEYRAGATERYAAERTADGSFHGHRVAVPVETIRLARGGTISTSLGNAVEGLRLKRSLVGIFVETFEGKADFSTHTRKGDTFRIIVDEERIAGRFHRYGHAHVAEYGGQRTGLLRAYWFRPAGTEGDYYDEEGRSIQGGWLRTPLRYDHISSRYNPRRYHPILKRVVPHMGVDYAAPAGTPVRAAAAGTLTFVGYKGANGNLAIIRHAEGYESVYAHLLRFERGIKVGGTVRQRQVIGYVGSTGRSTGPHLHFGLKRHGRLIDPLKEINGPGRMMSKSYLPRYRRQVRRLRKGLDKVRVEPPRVATKGKAPVFAAPDQPMD